LNIADWCRSRNRTTQNAQESLHMSILTRPATSALHQTEEPKMLQVIVYGHSAVLYWWPLWVVGSVMALVTTLHNDHVKIGNSSEMFHPSRNLGVIYTLLFLLLIVITSTNVRGMRAALMISSLAFVTLLLAYLDWWEPILDFLSHESIYMNRGFYLYSSALLCVIWMFTVFLIDHLSFWRFRPGQITHEYLGGIVDKSYDTDNMIVTKRQDDLFRHWFIGLGSGDLLMQTMGGRGVEVNVPNVLFVIGKMSKIQRLIATKPDVPQKA
jgi:hypothetical protein